MTMNKIKTINELLALTPEEVDNELSVLAGSRFNHMPEAQMSDYWEWEIQKLKTDKIEIRYYKNYHFDFRRFWRLASVWFEGKPFMIIQNAGREGDDHHKRFVFDQNVYMAAVQYLRVLYVSLPVSIADETKERLSDRQSEIEGLTEFYDRELNGYFSRDGF